MVTIVAIALGLFAVTIVYDMFNADILQTLRSVLWFMGFYLLYQFLRKRKRKFK